MYFIHYIQTYASVNRKGSELQSHILKFKDCLLKDRNALDDLKEEIHCRIEELDARYLLAFKLRIKKNGYQQWVSQASAHSSHFSLLQPCASSPLVIC
jgi:hypothetical protein